MKVAYWPGCVSRGFTPELHGAMAKVAPLLDIELIELDRASCCGAGVIAEHNQELADTLNARTFALAQQTDVLLGNYHGTPTHVVSVLEGMRAAFPNAQIAYVPGTQCTWEPYFPPSAARAGTVSGR